MLAFLMPSGLAFAQGIVFEQNSSWQQLLEKAKKENKYLFVDCYATWCGPCKKMDYEVYPEAAVGQFMNDKFISVKIQVDSSRQDNENIRAKYADAKMVAQKYQIAVLPTFLFFSPDGKLVYESTSFQAPKVFITTAAAALDPVQQKFYSRLENYQNGKKEYPNMLDLIKRTQDILKDRVLTDIMAKDYKENYLDHLNEDELATKENLIFLANHYSFLNSKGVYFNLIYHHPEKADKIVNIPGYSSVEVKAILSKEEIWSKLFKDDKHTHPYIRKPNWKKLCSNIRGKYNLTYSDSLVFAAKGPFYRQIGDWKTYVKIKDAQHVKYPPRIGALWGAPDNIGMLNSDAWDVFLHCGDKQILEQALAWSDLSIKLGQPNPNEQYLDTRANLLYKLGRVKEAIEQEQKAIDRLNARLGVQDHGNSLASEYLRILEKMRKGLATWPASTIASYQ